ncbi:hypothetical protein VTN77DRAFT_9075 [Rasamsonia byssochlamydoides]|uniref:uncharacterized protein n=1 Tax=Rasamsonia byssochlamydoides TaxID=89139 RepID=UPI003743110D
MASSDAQGHRAKRRKIASDGPLSSVAENDATISSHKQLRALLIFQQDAPSATKEGINKFKDFLTSINQSDKETDKAKKLQILKAYCDSQIKTVADGSEAICFPDLIQTWSFADSNNNESLLVAVPSVLALFLKTISTQLEFRDFGIALCKYLLQKEQLKLFNRNLTSQKAKEHLISPCIRLLTEIVSFDGGSVARLVYSKREITYKRLDVFLTPNKAQTEEALDESRKSTLRRNAQRYVLANLRFQNGAAKREFIEQHKVIRAFLEHIRRDSCDIVVDIIKAIDRDIAHDSSLPRSTKTKFFNRWNLERLVTLYGYDRDSDAPESETMPIAKEIHKVLTQVCTVSEMGVLLPQNGWYPTGSDPDALLTEDDASIELGLDSPIYMDKYRDSVPVRNGTLSSLIQVLRPESDTLQTELLLAIFKAAPELVADFFTKRTMFTSDPKPTPSWMGESAFLFSTVQLPVPVNCGWKEKVPAMPPPISIVIENILPRPLTQKVLSRCLNQNTDGVITLFAVRILTVAFRKLQAVLKVFNADHGLGQRFWNQASSKLIAEFCRRCPPMKDAVLTFKRTPKEDLQQRDAIMELLSMFYEIVPSIAFEENFDVTLILVDVLNQLEKPGLSADDSELLLSQLQNILKIAHQSASMRWWQQPASLQYSAFTSVLKVLVGAPDKTLLQPIRALLRSVLVESSVLISAETSFDALLSSLEASSSESISAQLEFLDNCVCRVVKKPVHYQDLVSSLLGHRPGSLSSLVAAVNEQWSFVIKANDASREQSVASWIAQLLGELRRAGEDEKALKSVRDNLVNLTESKKTRSIFKKALKSTAEINDGDEEMVDADLNNDQAKAKPAKSADLAGMFGSLPTESDNHTALHKWENDEIGMAIEKGRIRDLMLCLCSEHEEIRRQAFAAVSRFMIKVKDSNYSEWRAIYILAGELRETANQLGFQTPLPWIAGECAASCLTVLTDPLHKMYGKVNRFLQKHPSWEIGKIPSYWIDKILLHEPEYDDGYADEINWLLDLLVRGLRTAQDLDIYRRANVFERILSFHNSPTLITPLKKKILHLVFRATQVGGGTTLTTRAAGISWVEGQMVGSDPHRAIMSELARAIYDSCDRERVDKWSGASIARLVERIGG